MPTVRIYEVERRQFKSSPEAYNFALEALEGGSLVSVDERDGGEDGVFWLVVTYEKEW
jgi:hypothetical protein